MGKNIKKTLTILLCYIFVVMMMPTNVIAKAVQAASENIPDYSNVFENGYVQTVLYKNKALISVGPFSGYKFYDDGEIIKSSQDDIHISEGISRFTKISVFDNKNDARKYYVYDMKDNNLIDIEKIIPQMEKAISNKVGYKVEIKNYNVSIVDLDDETLWYRTYFYNSDLDKGYCIILNENFTQILIFEDAPYKIKKNQDGFIVYDGMVGEEDENGDFIVKNPISIISSDGKIIKVDTKALDDKYILFNDDIIYAYNSYNNKLEEYKLENNKLNLVSSLDIKGVELDAYNIGMTVDANGYVWFIGKENSKVYLYKVEDGKIKKVYKINSDYYIGDLTVYDDNNIVVSCLDRYKHTVIQNKVNQWVSKNGKWYYYNSNGQLATGWQSIGGTWYYFNNSGVMQTGWQSIGGTWYYFNNSGAMQTGWQSIGGTWYYFNNSGAMQTGWQSIGGVWYYFNNSGAMQTGWQSIGGTWYYFNNSGAMQTGWKSIGGVWYYFNNSGAMQTGWKSIGGTWYYFNNSGAMQTGWKSIGGKWYYFYIGGNMAVNTAIDGWSIDGSGVATQQ